MKLPECMTAHTLPEQNLLWPTTTQLDCCTHQRLSKGARTASSVPHNNAGHAVLL
jgi:hypothetical protein